MTPPIRSLQDLKPLRRQIEQARQQARAAALEAARREAERRHQVEARDAQLFARTVGPVHPLRETLHGSPRLYLRPTPPRPIAIQQQLDDQAVLRATLSDEFDVSTLLETDDQLSFRRPGIGPDVTRKLRRGEWSIQRELDLHGLRTDDARQALADFIRSAVKHGLRCVRVIHGKGLGSPGKTPVLKSRVQGWLVQKNEVLAFVQAKPAEGGAGALLVLLQGGR